MNKTAIWMVAALVISLGEMSAQSTSHPTISDINTTYLSTPQTTLSGNNADLIGCIPQTTVDVYGYSNVHKVNLKLYDPVSDSLLFSQTHPIGQTPLLDSLGNVLFERQGLHLMITTGKVMPLKRYRYKITTEDSLQNMSPNYIKIQ